MLRAFLLSLVVLSAIQAQDEAPTVAAPASEVTRPAHGDPSLASLEGMILDVSGVPVPGVIVRITTAYGGTTTAATALATAEEYSATTDTHGVYRMDGIVPGTYATVVYHSKYVLDMSGKAGLAVRAPFVLQAGEHKSDHSFRMRMNPTISGRVTDQDGKPVEADVMLVRKTSEGNLFTAQPANFEIDADGNYTISNFPEGLPFVLRFALKARYIDPDDLPDITNDPESTLVETFYPGVEQFSAATPLQIVGGRDLTNINIRLLKGTRYRIRARLEHPEDVADESVIANLVPLDADQILPPSGNITDGVVEFIGVPAGRYLIQTDPYALKKDEGREHLLVGQETVTVGKSNLDGVTIRANAVASVRIKTIYESGAGSPETARERAPLGLQPVTAPWMSAGISSPVDGDTILQTVPPGDYTISGGFRPGEFMKGAKYGGQEVAGGMIHVAPGSNNILEVHVGFSAGQITGVVVDKDQKPISGAVLTLRLTSEVPGRARILNTFTSATGEFKITVAPGRYSVLAWSREDAQREFESNIEREFTTQGVTVEVKDSGTYSVNLALVRLDSAR
jgi:protocatechuate 3,4-dioxygenase beta subunit